MGVFLEKTRTAHEHTHEVTEQSQALFLYRISFLNCGRPIASLLNLLADLVKADAMFRGPSSARQALNSK
jgi:hypothetical protein